ncbi:MAG: 1-(5-phosphoribosyl)-5-[(5-phosphoribosylamino)methylideneamino]imidazole-4-carboxamide isomerase [Chitinophagaceae bacterium]|jgi:phosphoribosylformimino-5-aminoimidazole carboxamide ribotide isomerase|nr:1-(5-phosphoribosyl)-5-[(5-phosphoribosylamino)methylideneamino]imidazole-4-carboxamide isomerase [Chitinophagaceae bacterium]
MQIIPAIDLIEGKCVRLMQGDYAQKKVYNQNPLEVAKLFEYNGLQRLHLVDLDGAKAGAVQNLRTLENIAAHTSLIIDFGGGVKTETDVNSVFNAGAALVTIGSLAVKQENTFVQWLNKYGAEKFLLGADVKDEKIAIHGWQEKTEIDIFSFIDKYLQHGIKQIFCTDISKDGALQGPSIMLYKEILKRFPQLYFIASGGVSNYQDLEDLQGIGCSAAIIGKAIYEEKIAVKDLKKFM